MKLGASRSRSNYFYEQRHSMNFKKTILQVPEIVAAVGTSRRPLEVAFKNETGRTINQEIVRIRIEKAKVRSSAHCFWVTRLFACVNHRSASKP